MIILDKDFPFVYNTLTKHINGRLAQLERRGERRLWRMQRTGAVGRNKEQCDALQASSATYYEQSE